MDQGGGAAGPRPGARWTGVSVSASMTLNPVPDADGVSGGARGAAVENTQGAFTVEGFRGP